MAVPPPRTLRTPRLLLRPTIPEDARRAFEIQSSWKVSRMLAKVGYPPSEREIEDWFRGHRDDWLAGSAFRFAITRDDVFLGVADFDEVVEAEGSLGYWLDENVWGQGIAREAASAVVQFAFDDVGLVRLRAGHADDNPASGKVLAALGFRYTGDKPLWYRSRGQMVTHRRHVLERDQRLLRCSG